MTISESAGNAACLDLSGVIETNARQACLDAAALNSCKFQVAILET